MRNYLNIIYSIASFSILLNITIIDAFTQERILITDFGASPGDLKNVVPAVKEALKVCATKESSILIFPTGRYDFWQDINQPSTDGIRMGGLKNVTIDGEGSEFIFHGNMQIANIFNCRNVTLRNFSVDWDHPFIYQGKYVSATDEYIDIWFDPETYTYVIEDSLFYLTGEGWKVRPASVYHDLYDKSSKEIIYKTHISNDQSVFLGKSEEIDHGIVRFYGQINIKPEPGTFTTLMAGRYMTVGINIDESKNIYLKDITIYHALSYGVAGGRNENITMDNVNIIINKEKGRVFSIMADAFHFINCKGLIKVINCAHTGATDNFINIHGIYTEIDSIVDDYSIITTQVRNIRPGEDIWFVNPVLCQRSEPRTIRFKQPLMREGRIVAASVILTEPIPEGVQTGDYIENKSWNPRVEIRNCRIPKSCCARGILVTTPEKVVIEDNYFQTAGTVILIKGDLDYWFESGANTDVSICNNVFEDCLSYGSISKDKWEWGEAIITIIPSHHPQNENSEPYHNNIRIVNNTFKTFDIPLVCARSVRGLTFSNNNVLRTYTYKPFTCQKFSFRLDGCRDVIITGNSIDKDYAIRTVEMEHMKKSDMITEEFNIINQK